MKKEPKKLWTHEDLVRMFSDVPSAKTKEQWMAEGYINGKWLREAVGIGGHSALAALDKVVGNGGVRTTVRVLRPDGSVVTSSVVKLPDAYASHQP
jgi:hypothetical protein